MRMNGAKLGRRVFVNSLDVTDHCLLEFGDDVVIGAGVHLSGHTVERGLVRTAPVRLGRQAYLLPRVLLGTLERFACTRSIQDASTEVQNLCEEEAERLVLAADNRRKTDELERAI